MKVLIVAFDGLQPNQINEDLMPNLYGYLNEGVTFTNHHAVYPSVTRINATSMFTGDIRALMVSVSYTHLTLPTIYYV